MSGLTIEMCKAYILSQRLSPSPEGEGWDGGAFKVKSKAPPSKSSPSGEDFKALKIHFSC
jgi:hypothetical protein